MNPAVPTSWIHPSLVAIVLDHGHGGVRASAPIAAGTLLCLWGGRVMSGAAFDRLPALLRRRSLQIEEDFFMVPPGQGELADLFNHGCDPNAGLDGQIGLRAMRDIAVDEQVRYDYATSDGSPYDEFDCGCGAPSCRGRVTGDDWRRADLQRRYAGFFSPYLARRIAGLPRS